MMKIAAIAALLAGSASAFSPSANGRVSTAISAEKSAALPFMNRPALVSWKNWWLLVVISSSFPDYEDALRAA